MHKWIVVTTIVAASAATAQGVNRSDASSKSYDNKTINGWLVNVQEDGCNISSDFTDKISTLQSSLYIKYEAGRDTLWLGFGHDKFASVEPDKVYEIETDFVVNGKLDTGWGKAKFTAFKGAGDKGGKLLSKFKSLDMLKDLSRAETIGFFKDDKLLASFPISNIVPAISVLKDCASAVEREHPVDPFAH